MFAERKHDDEHKVRFQAKVVVIMVRPCYELARSGVAK